MPTDSRALLFCAGGGIGDSLVATVVARALHQRYAFVDALTLPAHRALLERVPDVDGVLVDGGAPEREIAQDLARGQYAAVVVTWATSRTARVAQLAGIPVRVGQARRLYSFRFTNRVVVRSERGDLTSPWSQVLLDYARAIGCDTTDACPRVVPTTGDGAEAEALMRELELARGAFAIVHPNNAVATQRGIWPTNGWSALVRALGERFALSVVVTGSDADRAIVERIAADGGGTPIAGRLSIGGFGALAARAAFFAGITTGTMHVAAAVGCPTAGIFPFQTDVPERWAPLGERTQVVRASYPCRRGERKETCPDYACIANLDVARILEAVRAVRSQAPLSRTDE